MTRAGPLALLSFLLMSLPALAADQPPVFLSHVYLVLDQPSFDALRSSKAVAELADVEEAHIESGSRSWSGFYVRGHHTYIELFGSDKPPSGGHLGDSGIGLQVEEAGGDAAVAARLRTFFGDTVETNAVPWGTKEGETLPWFTAVSVKGDDADVLSTWIMEIDPGYLAARHPGDRIDHPLSREQYLSWKFRPDRPLDDVVGVTVALKPPELTRLRTLLQAVGWSIEQAGGGFVATGPDVRVDAKAVNGRAGILELALRLRQSVAKQMSTLGTTSLELDGKSGRLRFRDAR